MKATVIYPFYDMQDKEEHVYDVGDKFPHDDRKISEKRLKELSSTKNKIGKKLIEIIEKDKEKEEKETKKKKTTKKKSDK